MVGLYQFIGAGGEIQLVASIKVQAENNMAKTVILNGKRFDCGNILGYVETINHIALNHNFD